MQNRTSFENQRNCTLIKHFIKELIRKIGPGFSGNPSKSRNPKIPKKLYGNLLKSQEINENQRKCKNHIRNPYRETPSKY